ncbi:MAG: amidohydrolase, partial [Candidatus Caldarchaeum sp.]|nr:amidohydrolase [Candidatus Caldarchaeum sp.]MDW8436286.1 amidohydrolase family protein [Candidatus Caldarchaeum sp.]
RHLIKRGEPRLVSAADAVGQVAVRWRQFVDLDKRLREMSKYGIDVQVACVHNRVDPSRFLLSTDEEIGLVRVLNDSMAELADKSGGRLVCLGSVALNSLAEGGVDEMRRTVEELGLKGFMVLTNIGGQPIDKFKDFWEMARKLDAVVYIHPTDPYQTSCRGYEGEYDLAHVVGWPFETTLIVLRLVLSGMMEKIKGLRILTHHAGGMIPFFMGRIKESYSPDMTVIRRDQVDKLKTRENLIEMLRTLFFYDTAVGGSREALKCAYEVFGAERLLFATDYPYGPDGGAVRLATYRQMVESLGLSREEEEAILHDNAEKILKNI